MSTPNKACIVAGKTPGALTLEWEEFTKVEFISVHGLCAQLSITYKVSFVDSTFQLSYSQRDGLC